MDRKDYEFAKKASRTAYENAIRDAVGGGGQPLPDTEQHRHPDYALVDHSHEGGGSEGGAPEEHTHPEYLTELPQHEHPHTHDDYLTELPEHEHEGGANGGTLYDGIVAYYIGTPASYPISLASSGGLMTSFASGVSGGIHLINLGRAQYGLTIFPTALPDGGVIPIYKNASILTYKFPVSSMRQTTDKGAATINARWNGDYHSQTLPVEVSGRGMTFVRGWKSTLYPNFYSFEAEKSGTIYSFVGCFPFDVECEALEG